MINKSNGTHPNIRYLVSMKKLAYSITISAPASRVYDTMLGISNKSNYEAWTALFNPTSTYEGSWVKGGKMLFVGVDENGEKGGMISEIYDLVPNQFVSIRHYGMLQAGVEITEGPEVEPWVNSFENYTFKEVAGQTEVTIALDTSEDFEEYMNQTYPQALAKLKALCEG